MGQLTRLNTLDGNSMNLDKHLNLGEKATQARSFLASLAREYALPNILIIGAQKAGTTSLASYLAAHPWVVSPTRKEVHFFDLNYGKSVNWYRSHFLIGGRRRFKNGLYGRHLPAFDATPYYIVHPQVAERASRLIPGARIIILLRDPVDRAYSHYHHEVRLGTERLAFEEAIDAESSRISGEAHRLQSDSFYESFSYQHFTYLKRGIYWEQIHRWLKYFRPDQFLVLSSEAFFKSPAIEYKKVLQFLGLPALELSTYPAVHVGKYPGMSAVIRDRLIEYYAAHNRSLKHELNSLWPGTGDEIVGRFSGWADRSPD